MSFEMGLPLPAVLMLHRAGGTKTPTKYTPVCLAGRPKTLCFLYGLKFISRKNLN
jgi:hypothetical protein